MSCRVRPTAMLLLLSGACVGRGEPQGPCRIAERQVVLLESFEGQSPVVSTAGSFRRDNESRTGSAGVTTNTGIGLLRTTAPLALLGRRAALGFWFHNDQLDGNMRVRLSTNGGGSFVDSSAPMPDLNPNRPAWTYLEADFGIDGPVADAAFALEVTVESTGNVFIDDVQVIDNPCNASGAAPISPDGMVWVTPSATVPGFWIDQYEAIVDVVSGLGDLDQSDDPNLDNGSTLAVALSRVATPPLTSISWYQARAACHNAGKRLCQRVEHNRACAGDLGYAYPYGDTRTDFTCGDGSVGVEENTGNRSGCVSSFGAYDLVGNVSEWVEDEASSGQRATAGGDYLEGASPSCAWQGAYPPGGDVYWLGFRCCRSGE